MSGAFLLLLPCFLLSHIINATQCLILWRDHGDVTAFCPNVGYKDGKFMVYAAMVAYNR